MGPRSRPSLRGQVAEGQRAAPAGPRPAPVGLSDFASKGELCDTCVCTEGPSVWGSAQGQGQGPVLFREEFFLSASPALLGPALSFTLLFSRPCWGHLVPVNTLGVLPHRSLPSSFSGGIICCLCP